MLKREPSLKDKIEAQAKAAPSKPKSRVRAAVKKVRTVLSGKKKR